MGFEPTPPERLVCAVRRIKMRIMFLAFLGLALLINITISLQHSQGASVDHPSLRTAHTGDSDGDSKRPANYMCTTGGDGEADEDDNSTGRLLPRTRRVFPKICSV